MVFKSRYEILATPEEVFDAMIAPETVAACLPGCDRLEPIGNRRYQATMTIGIAAIKGRFKGTVELRNLDRPVSYELRINGRGPAGFARGSSSVVLSDGETGTSVKVQAKAQVGGPVARVGQRLLAGTAKMVADRFFGCLRKKIESASSRG